MKQYYETKWTEDNVREVRNRIRTQIIKENRYFDVLQLPYCQKVYSGLLNEFQDIAGIVVPQSWVGGSMEIIFRIVVKSIRDNEFYVMELNYSRYVSYWTTISHYLNDQFEYCEYYESFEETLEAIDQINSGVQPYRIIARCYPEGDQSM